MDKVTGRQCNLSQVKTVDLITELERRCGFMHKETTVDLSSVRVLEILEELQERNGFGNGIDIKYVNPYEPFHIEVKENGQTLHKDSCGPAMIIVVTN